MELIWCWLRQVSFFWGSPQVFLPLRAVRPATNFHESNIGDSRVRENSWLAEQGFWGEAPKPLFALRACAKIKYSNFRIFFKKTHRHIEHIEILFSTHYVFYVPMC